MHTAQKKSFTCTIYIGGALLHIEAVCANYCNDNKLCVSVSPVSFVYPGGEESGASINLIQYPKFPRDTSEIESHAHALMRILLDKCDQNSATLVTPDTTTWIDKREEDPRLA